MSREFLKIPEIGRVAQQRGQFLQLLKTQVTLILDFTRPYAITCLQYKGKNLISSYKPRC